MDNSEDSGIPAGAVVQLKSGSPPMTVRCIEEGCATCDWYDGGHQKGFQREAFTVAQLLPVAAPQGRL